MDFDELWEQNKFNIIYFGTVLIVIIFLFFLFIHYNGRAGYYHKKVTYKEKRVERLKQYVEEYEKLKRTSGVSVSNKIKLKGTLLSYFGSVTKKLGLQGNVTTMKPIRGEKGKKIIEIKLEKIMLEDAVKLLFEVEKKSNLALKIKRFKIRKRVDNPKLLNMVLQVEVL